MKLASAMIRLCVSVEGHSHLGEENQVVGKSIRVGIIIFSIVKGLSFGDGLCHGFEL